MTDKIPERWRETWRRWNKLQGAKSPRCRKCGGMIHVRYIDPKGIRPSWIACQNCGRHYLP